MVDMKLISPPLQIALGVCLFVGGFVYDVMFAGIPYQDPTPEMAASFNLHSRIASWVRWGGIGIVSVGCLVMIARRLNRGRTQRVEH